MSVPEPAQHPLHQARLFVAQVHPLSHIGALVVLAAAQVAPVVKVGACNRGKSTGFWVAAAMCLIASPMSEPSTTAAPFFMRVMALAVSRSACWRRSSLMACLTGGGRCLASILKPSSLPCFKYGRVYLKAVLKEWGEAVDPWKVFVLVITLKALAIG